MTGKHESTDGAVVELVNVESAKKEEFNERESVSDNPARALQLDLWPGLPKPGPDAGIGQNFENPARDHALPMAGADEIESGILDGTYAEMVEAFDELSGAVRAEIADEIGDRLFDCWGYSERSPDDLEEQGAEAFERKLRFGELLAAQMAPGVAEHAVREMARLDRDRWVADWIAEQVTQQAAQQARCAGVEALPAQERLGAAVDWWERAAALGNLEARARWVGIAFHSIGMSPGNAVEFAELKPRVLDAVHALLRERYAPILVQLMMFEFQGVFAPPNEKRAWIYGEASRRIAERAAGGRWRVPDEMARADMNGVRDHLDRIEAEMTPGQRREAEAWVRAIVELPER